MKEKIEDLKKWVTDNSSSPFDPLVSWKKEQYVLTEDVKKHDQIIKSVSDVN